MSKLPIALIALLTTMPTAHAESITRTHAPREGRATRETLPVVSHGGKAATSRDQAPRSSEITQFIVAFKDVKNNRDVKNLRKELQAIGSGIELASAKTFKNRKTPCAGGACAVVSESQLNAIKASGLKASVIGERKITLPALEEALRSPLEKRSRKMDYAKRVSSPGNRGTQAGTAAKTTAGATTLFYSLNVTNPDIVTNYIPDMGYQELGDRMPLTARQYIAPNAYLTQVDYEVGFYHQDVSDLYVEIGYDEAPLGGTFTEATPIWNHWTGSDYQIVTGTTHVFDGNHPDSYYYVGAWDTVPGYDGFLDYVYFDLWWTDYPELTVYGPASTHLTSTGGYIGAYVDMDNLSYVDITNLFDVNVYLLRKTTSTSCPLYHPTLDTWSSSYYLGYKTNAVAIPSMGSSAVTIPYRHVSAIRTMGGFGTPITNGVYCVYAKIDALNEIDEGYESDNIVKISELSITGIPSVSVANVSTAQLTVFPNPTTSALNIALSDDLVSSKVAYSIADLSGRIIESGSSEGQPTIQVNVRNFAPGTYIVTIQGEGANAITSKFVKQ